MLKKLRRLHISQGVDNSKDWSAYLEHSAPLVINEDLEFVSDVAIAWARSHNVEKVIVHHTSSNAEIIYSL